MCTAEWRKTPHHLFEAIASSALRSGAAPRLLDRLVNDNCHQSKGLYEQVSAPSLREILRESIAAYLKVFVRHHEASCILWIEQYNYSRMRCATDDLQVG